MSHKSYSRFVLAVAGLLYLSSATALQPEMPTDDSPKTTPPAGSCKTSYPDPQPLWIDSNNMVATINDVIKKNPDTQLIKIGIWANGGKEAIGMDIELKAGLAANQSVVILDNQVNSGWEREIAGLNGAQGCFESFRSRIPGHTTSAPIFMTSNDTTWIELRKPTAPWQWVTMFRWTEPGFWSVFGGRRVTFRWVGD